MKRVAVVTGANRGLGFETSRQLLQKGYQVVLTSRDTNKGLAAIEKIRSQKLDAIFHQLDVTDEQSMATLITFLEKEMKRVDVLVNNAGILPHASGHNSAFEEKIESIREAIETNVYGAFRLTQKIVPLMRKNHYGRVVNVSSGMGQLSEMNGGYAAYRISKTALNAVTRIFADETDGQNILINSVCPGWVKTDMGGEGAEREIPQGADTIVWLATLADGSPTGGFFRDREPIAW